MSYDMNRIVGSCDLIFITFDTLRYDAAERVLRDGTTPNLKQWIGGNWEQRHTPGSFTYAAHHAFFAGYLPTPIDPQLIQHRLFAARFEGSVTTSEKTCQFETADIVSGLAGTGYRTVCVGGVHFFNQLNPLGRVLPDLFQESHWRPEFGVDCRDSARFQLECAAEEIAKTPTWQPLFLFINLSAVHPPNFFYSRSQGPDNLESHCAALRYIDTQIPLLRQALRTRTQETFYIFTGDHGTAYGEDGYQGHRRGHPVVWTVPYADGLLF